MKTFIVGLSRAKSCLKIGSEAIQISEKRNFGHAYIKVICPITGRLLIAQASHGCINMMSLEIFLKDNIIVKEYEISCTEKDFIEMHCFICDNLGISYSQMQILFIAIKKLAHFEIPSYNKDKYFICSEFTARICQIVGISIPGVNLDYFTPSDMDTALATAVVNQSDKVKLLIG